MSEHDDDLMMDELRGIARELEPVPPEIVAAAEASLTWRTVDDELAELAFDSLLEPGAMAGTRGGAGPRLLTFSAGERHVEVEVTTLDRHCRLVGQLVPPNAAAVEVRAGVGTVTVQADEIGRFTAESIPAGPTSLRVTIGGTSVTTAWVIL